METSSKRCKRQENKSTLYDYDLGGKLLISNRIYTQAVMQVWLELDSAITVFTPFGQFIKSYILELT